MGSSSIQKFEHSFLHRQECLPLMEVCIICMMSFQLAGSLLRVEMTVQLASESLCLMEQVQTQVVSLKSSEVYFSIDINYVFVVTKGSP